MRTPQRVSSAESLLRPFLSVLLEPVYQRGQKRFGAADAGGRFFFADDVAAVVVQVSRAAEFVE